MSIRRRITVSAVAIIALLFPIFAAGADTISFGNDYFERTWARTDLPVATHLVDRTWSWGPGPNTGTMWEPYLESPGGQREVQYFDKSRMERNLTGEPEDSIWYVTNGLLVVEMMTGRIQVGDDSFEPHEAETNNVAGDRAGTTGPTYAALNHLRPAVEDRGSEPIIQIVDQNGNVTEDPGLADQGIYTDYYDEITGHNIAEPFWKFMTSNGLIYEDGNYFHSLIVPHPVYATGRPITEPYWAHVPVAGVEQWVLVQAFERRVLTYTPGNSEGWKVESGNVGRHYFEWRYGHPVDIDPPSNDDSANGGNGGTGGGNGGGGNDDSGNGGDDDTGNGGDDDGGDNGDDDGDNGGPSLPTDLGLGIQANVNSLGTQLDATVTLNNPSNWSGPVDVELICGGQVVDSGVVNIAANGSAQVPLSYSSGNLVNIQVCTVNALINGQLVDSGTIAVVDLLPELPLLPDLGLNIDADISNVNGGLLSSCDATVVVDVQLTNTNDYVGPVDVHIKGLGIDTWQTVNLNGSGSIPIEVQGQGIGLLNLLSIQTYEVKVYVDNQQIASGSATTAALNPLGLLCL